MSKKTSWDDHFYLRCYEMARSGLSDSQISEALGVFKTTFVKWRKEKDALVDALLKGRQAFFPEGKKEEREGFLAHVYSRLPKDLSALWDEMQKADLSGDCSPGAFLRVDDLSRKYLFLHALVEMNFSPSRACTRVSLSTNILQKWLKEDQDFKRLYDEVQWHKGNLFEEKLVERVQQGDTAAIVFANKTFNRDRGYGEVHYLEVGGKVDHEHRFTLEGLDLPLEVRKVILSAIKKKEEQDDLSKREDGRPGEAVPLLGHRQGEKQVLLHEKQS